MVEDSGGSNREVRFVASTHGLVWVLFTGGFKKAPKMPPAVITTGRICFKNAGEFTSDSKKAGTPASLTLTVNLWTLRGRGRGCCERKLLEDRNKRNKRKRK
jgi:hypothetical protein